MGRMVVEEGGWSGGAVRSRRCLFRDGLPLSTRTSRACVPLSDDCASLREYWGRQRQHTSWLVSAVKEMQSATAAIVDRDFVVCPQHGGLLMPYVFRQKIILFRPLQSESSHVHVHRKIGNSRRVLDIIPRGSYLFRLFDH